MTTAVQNQSEIMAFPSANEWEEWLRQNHAASSGVWLRIFKKGSGIISLSYPEALNAALCFGWIDGQLKPCDEKSWLRRFTPRRPKSIWSKRNQQLVAKLMEAGKMQPAGLKEVELAKTDGRWERAYDSPSKMQLPEDFLKELYRNKAAQTFFETLNKANTYAIAWRLQTAKKPETRARRMRDIIEMLARGETFHS